MTKYPDAQLFIDLRAHTADAQPLEPTVALDTLLRAIGVPGERIPADLDERAALWRSEMADRKALVVLDNAADAAQVRPLLPGAAGCLVLITSRRRLADLDTVSTLSLDVLDEDEALSLFARIIGGPRMASEPDAAGNIVRLCGRLPLAIRIAAARLRARPAWSIHDLERRLAEEHRLSELAVGDRSVVAALALSYRDLTGAQQRMFRLLGLIPGPTFDAYVAAALADVRLDVAQRLLEELLDAHLLQQSQPGRYHFHDLVRDHARVVAESSESDEDRSTAIRRMFDYYLHVSILAGTVIAPQMKHPVPRVLPVSHAPRLENLADGSSWCEVEQANLIAAIEYAAAHGLREYAVQISLALRHFFYLRGYVHHWISTLQSALVLVGQSDTLECALAHKSLAIALCQASRADEALEHASAALEIYRSKGDKRDQADTLNNMGQALGYLGMSDRALACLRNAVELYREIGNRWGEGNSLNNVGYAEVRLGRDAEAREDFAQALALYRETGDRRGQGGSLCNLGEVCRRLNEHAEALEHYREALGYAREIGDRHLEAEIVNGMGDVYRDLGQAGPARTSYENALRIAVEAGAGHQEANAHRGLGHLHRATDRDVARHHWTRALELYRRLKAPGGDLIQEELNKLDALDQPDRSSA